MALDLIPTTTVCQQLRVCSKTLERWEKDPSLNFPKPIRIKTRRYWLEGDIQKWIDAQKAPEMVAA